MARYHWYFCHNHMVKLLMSLLFNDNKDDATFVAVIKMDNYHTLDEFLDNM